MIKKFNTQTLNGIINKLSSSMNQGKSEAIKFKLTIDKELINLEKALELSRKKADKTLLDKTMVIKKRKSYQLRLATLSKQISGTYTNHLEREIETTYQEAEKFLIKERELEEKFQQLFKERDELERRYSELADRAKEAESLIHSISTSYKYLTEDLSGIGEHLDNKEKTILKILKSQENERHRLSRELHDGIVQTLTHLNLETRFIKQLLKMDSPKEIESRIDELETHLIAAIDESRQLIYDLKPMSLDDIGLIPTLISYFASFEKKKKFSIKFRHNDTDFRFSSNLDDAIKLIIFRVIQESLTNIYKHANASEVKIRLEFNREKVNLLIKDDGDGFNYSEDEHNPLFNGNFGIIGMRERVEMVGGDFRISSTKGLGTRVVALIPNKIEVDDEYFI